MLLFPPMDADVRWKQRLNSFERALAQLAKFIQKGDLNELEEQGLIQAFEYTYELGWNLLRDYLTNRGVTELFGSRDVIREAFRVELISDGETWMAMLQDRNRTSHTYNEETARAIADAVIGRYYESFVALRDRMVGLAGDESQKKGRDE